MISTEIGSFLRLQGELKGVIVDSRFKEGLIRVQARACVLNSDRICEVLTRPCKFTEEFTPHITFLDSIPAFLGKKSPERDHLESAELRFCLMDLETEEWFYLISGGFV